MQFDGLYNGLYKPEDPSQPSFSVRDLDGDKEPEVLVNLSTRGSHCCFYSLIYRYQVSQAKYTNIESFNEFKAFHLESRKLGKVVFSNTDSATEDTTYRSIDLSVRGDVSRVAGGSLYPNVFEIFPSISPINYTPLIR